MKIQSWNTLRRILKIACCLLLISGFDTIIPILYAGKMTDFVDQWQIYKKWMGLDPKVWFRNVEVVAAKRIGRETVQYVSNIYKYFLAYKLVRIKMEVKQRETSYQH